MQVTIQHHGLRGLLAIFVMASPLKLGAEEPAPTILFDAPFRVEAPITCEAITTPQTTAGPRPVWQCHFPIGQWERGIASFRQAAEQANAERDQALAEIAELGQRLHDTQTELQDVRKALADKQRELNERKDDDQAKTGRITSLTTERDACQTHIAALSSERDNLEQQLAETEGRVQNAQQRVLAKTSSLNQTIEQLGAVKAELQAKQQQYTALHTISNQQTRRTEAAEKQLAALRDQLRDMQANQAGLASELDKARAAQNALAHDKAALEQQQNKTAEALRQARDELAEYQQTSQRALRDQQAKAAACLTRLNELPKLKQRIAGLQSQLADSDSDGISDADDRCADTPAGHPVNASGCEQDMDQDGTPDSADLCPDIAANDTRIPGCPDGAPIRLTGVQFHFNSDRIKAESEVRLQQVIDTLNAHPDVAVEIAGHTDSIGEAPYNQRLSLLRAEKVRDYLVEHGIVEERLRAKGYGESQPSGDNNTVVGRAENRRVELRVLPAETR